MKINIEILEKDIDILLEEIKTVDLLKSDTYGLCQRFMKIEETWDDITDSSKWKNLNNFEVLKEKMKRLHVHFYKSSNSKEYFVIMDHIMDKEIRKSYEEKSVHDNDANEDDYILNMMFPEGYDDD